jgi:hypothetical protein
MVLHVVGIGGEVFFFFEGVAGVDVRDVGEHFEVGDGEGDDGVELGVGLACIELDREGFGGVVEDLFFKAEDVEHLHFDDDGASVMEGGFDVEKGVLHALELGGLIGVEDDEVLKILGGDWLD